MMKKKQLQNNRSELYFLGSVVEMKMKILPKRIIFFIIFIIFFSIQVSYSENSSFDHTEIFNNHNLPKMIVNIETGEIVEINIAATNFYNENKNELLKMRIFDLSLFSEKEMKSKLIDAYMEKRDYFKSEYSLDNNQLKRVEIYTYPINNDHGRFLYITILDKTEEVHLANEIEINRKLQLRLIFLVLVVFIVFLILVFKEKEKYKRLSHYDLLTGAYSRTFLDKWLNEVKGNYKTNRKNKFVVMIDINQFKFINDEYGHLVGDQVLKFVTEILKKYTRINDLVIRFGGDEFVLIIEESKESVVYLVLDRIKSELRKNNKFNFSIEISYGVEHISDYDDLFQV